MLPFFFPLFSSSFSFRIFFLCFHSCVVLVSVLLFQIEYWFCVWIFLSLSLPLFHRIHTCQRVKSVVVFCSSTRMEYTWIHCTTNGWNEDTRGERERASVCVCVHRLISTSSRQNTPQYLAGNLSFRSFFHHQPRHILRCVFFPCKMEDYGLCLDLFCFTHHSTRIAMYNAAFAMYLSIFVTLSSYTADKKSVI